MSTSTQPKTRGDRLGTLARPALASLCLAAACSSDARGPAKPPSPTEMTQEARPGSSPQGSLPNPGDDAPSVAAASTILSFGILQNRPMKVVLRNGYQEGFPPLLTYAVQAADGNTFSFDVVFDSRFDIPSTKELGVERLTLHEVKEGQPKTWRAVSGRIEISGQESRLRAVFKDVELRDVTGATRLIETGEVAGLFERACFSRVVNDNLRSADGTPVYRHESDPDWNSDYCRTMK
jgi:hypothetical protein